MPDEITKNFVRSFLVFLKKEACSKELAADAQESLEVAVQCLQAAFDIEEVEDGSASGGGAVGGAEAPADVTASAATNTSAAAGGSAQDVFDPKKIDLYELFQSVYVEKSPKTAELAESIKNDGNRLMEEGKYYEALLQYNRAIAFNPKNPIYYCNRAAAYIRLSDNERAVIDCKSALVYNPKYSKAYGRLGIAYSNLGKYEEAEQAYSKAIELDPENQDYRNNLEVARNARAQATVHPSPQLTAGLNAMLSSPTIRSIFSNADIDLEQLQNMSQNPIIMNAIGQMFSNIQGVGTPMQSESIPVPPMPNDMMQFFQTLASQLTSALDERNVNPGGNNNPNNRQPPST